MRPVRTFTNREWKSNQWCSCKSSLFSAQLFLLPVMTETNCKTTVNLVDSSHWGKVKYGWVERKNLHFLNFCFWRVCCCWQHILLFLFFSLLLVKKPWGYLLRCVDGRGWAQEWCWTDTSLPGRRYSLLCLSVWSDNVSPEGSSLH